MMIEAKNFKGIEYVQLAELPEVQRERMAETINKDLFIKIMIDGKIVSDCLQYKHYSVWFNSIFRQVAVEVPAKEKAIVELQTDLAFK
jgi:hypothetical protein